MHQRPSPKPRSALLSTTTPSSPAEDTLRSKLEDLCEKYELLHNQNATLTVKMEAIEAKASPFHSDSPDKSSPLSDEFLHGLVQRLTTIEDVMKGNTITYGGMPFLSVSDIQAFVHLYVPDPNVGLICDVVTLLENMQSSTVTTYKVIKQLEWSKKVALDPLEIIVLASYSLTLPGIFDRSGEAVTNTNANPLPAITKFNQWHESSCGLWDKVNDELPNSLATFLSREEACRLPIQEKMVFSDLVHWSKYHDDLYISA